MSSRSVIFKQAVDSTTLVHENGCVFFIVDYNQRVVRFRRKDGDPKITVPFETISYIREVGD